MCWRRGRKHDLVPIMTVVVDTLPDDPETLKAMLIAERTQNERLRQIIKELQRHRFVSSGVPSGKLTISPLGA